MLQVSLLPCRAMLDLCGESLVYKAIQSESCVAVMASDFGANDLAQGFGDTLTRIHRDRQMRKLLADDLEVVCLSQKALACKKSQ